MQCMAKYNNKMQFLNSSARVAHNTAEEGPHTWIQKILRKVAKHLRHNKSSVADQYSDAAAMVRHRLDQLDLTYLYLPTHDM